MLVMEVISDDSIRVVHYSGHSEADMEVIARFFSSFSGRGSADTIARIQQEVVSFSADELSTLDHLTYPASFTVSEDPVQRALSREHEADYGVFTNNCESFVNWSHIGHNVTPQGARAQHAIAGTAAGSFAGGALGAAIGHFGLKYFEEEDGKPIDEATKRKVEVGAAIGGAFIGALLGYGAGSAYTDSQTDDL